MHTEKLGLPFEYQKYPEFFDALNISHETESKNALIARLLKKYHAKTVLDLTCGTGSQVFYLSKKGFKVTGSDFSPELLKMARKRARVEKVGVQFLDGDMRTIKVGVFDSAITIFNAVGHLTKQGFQKAMQNINDNLKVGGVYIFDILNYEAINDKIIPELSYHVHTKLKNSHLHAVQCSTLDKKARRLVSYTQCMLQNRAQKPENFSHKFSLQIYSASELKAMLEKSGFKVVAQYDMQGLTFRSKKSLSILTVAMKTNGEQ